MRLLRSRLFLAIAAALLTLACVLVVMNLGSSQKKLQKGLVRHYALRDPSFEREVGVLLGPAIVGGNRVTALQNGDEIFPQLLAAVREAQQTITFETFIYWSGDIGTKMADALSERARSGVRVHVLLDWVGSSKMDETLLNKMKKAGVHVRQYRPLSWYHLARMNNRTHRKLLVVDGRLAFTGGVGIADQWKGDALGPEQWRDSHYRIEGPVVAQVQAAFNDNWVKTTGALLHGEAFFPRLESAGELGAQMFLASPAGGSESMHLMYLLAITAASQTIDLSAAYFVPDSLIVEALLTARKRGVKIRVLVPGKHIDSATVRLASKAGWEPLLRAGVEIFEFQPTMLHSKMLVIDRYLVSVGSTNFDIRSFHLNDEASLNVYDEDFATEMTSVFEADLKRARRYSLNDWIHRPWTQKFSEKFVLPIRQQL